MQLAPILIPLVETHPELAASVNAEVNILSCHHFPTGTHKDLRSRYIVEHAKAEGIQRLALITNGNAGLSLVKAAENTGIEIGCIMNRFVRIPVEQALRATGAKVSLWDLNYYRHMSGYPDNLIDYSMNKDWSSRPDHRVKWNVTAGFQEAYMSLLDSVEALPDVIIVPMATGELAEGLRLGIEARQGDAKVMAMCLRDSLNTSIADKLWGNRDHNELFKEWKSKGYGLEFLTEEDAVEAASHINGKLPMEPSAAVVFAGLKRVKEDVKSVLLINTGKGIF